jgi:hypothetical protein
MFKPRASTLLAARSGTGRPSHWTCCLARALLLLIAAGSVAAAQDIGRDLPETKFNSGPFRFSSEARNELRHLWNASIDAKQERVACMGGYVADGVAYVTHVLRLDSPKADSASISAIASLVRCGPPEWLGTVHTHIAKFDGQPFIVFSQSDRSVMLMWRRRWHTEGVFCILYSDSEANCEDEFDLTGQAPYAFARGNNIL